MNTNGAMVSYAQNREDVLLARVFRDVVAGFYVDVGANDPEHCSVTKHFYDRGWRGINVEPGRVFHRLAAARPRDVNLNVAASDRAGTLTLYEYLDGALSGLSSLHPDTSGSDPEQQACRSVRQVEARTLLDIFLEHAPPQIDFLSVDVEQHERQVLLGNDWEAFRPRVVLVEATEPQSPVPSFESWERILLDARYDFVHFDGLNRYYLRREDQALRERFAAPACVFDNYILADTVALHGRLERLQEELALREQQLQEARLETRQWRENASSWCQRADEARRETATALNQLAQARDGAARTEEQLRQQEAEARRLAAESEERRGRLDDALRLLAEQAETLSETAKELAAANAHAAGLLARVEEFERLGARPLALLRRWARFRDGHPTLVRALKRVTRHAAEPPAQ